MNETTIDNAVIRGATIRIEDNGILDCWLDLDYGGSGQGFGGWTLYLPKSFNHHELESCAGHFIYRVLEVAEVTDWSKLVGKTVRAKHNHANVEAIGHIIKNDWFCPAEDFATMQERKTQL